MNKMIVALVLATLSVTQELSADEVTLNGIYLAGYVKDDKGAGVENANVIVTQNQRKLFVLRTLSNGWFETVVPLDSSYIKKNIEITIMKRGFNIQQEEFKIKENMNFYSFTMKEILGYFSNEGNTSFFSSVINGYVFDEETGKPVKGAIIMLQGNSKEGMIGSGVTRSSGYFDLFYQENENDDSYIYQAEHGSFDTIYGTINDSDKEGLLRVGLTQNRYNSLIGFGYQFQNTYSYRGRDTQPLSLALNWSWYPEEFIIVNGYRPKIDKNYMFGLDFALGLVPYVKEKEGRDKSGSLVSLNIGATVLMKDFPLNIRFGIGLSEEESKTVYLGFSLPIKYF